MYTLRSFSLLLATCSRVLSQESSESAVYSGLPDSLLFCFYAVDDSPAMLESCQRSCASFASQFEAANAQSVFHDKCQGYITAWDLLNECMNCKERYPSVSQYDREQLFSNYYECRFPRMAICDPPFISQSSSDLTDISSSSSSDGPTSSTISSSLDISTSPTSSISVTSTSPPTRSTTVSTSSPPSSTTVSSSSPSTSSTTSTSPPISSSSINSTAPPTSSSTVSSTSPGITSSTSVSTTSHSSSLISSPISTSARPTTSSTRFSNHTTSTTTSYGPSSTPGTSVPPQVNGASVLASTLLVLGVSSFCAFLLV